MSQQAGISLLDVTMWRRTRRGRRWRRYRGECYRRCLWLALSPQHAAPRLIALKRRAHGGSILHVLAAQGGADDGTS